LLIQLVWLPQSGGVTTAKIALFSPAHRKAVALGQRLFQSLHSGEMALSLNWLLIRLD
jgi:hypothetical protein